MKIVQIITTLDPAGAERIVAELTIGLLERKHRMLVVSLIPVSETSPIVVALRTAGVDVRSLGLSKRRPLRVLSLRAMLDSFTPDVVHAHLFHAAAAVVLSGATGFRTVQTLHGCDRRPGQAWRFLWDRSTRSRWTQWTSVSSATARFYAPRLGMDPEDIRVIPNGIRSPRAPGPEEIMRLRRDWGVHDCSFVLGSVGRLDQQKGYDRLFPVLHRLGTGSGETWGVVLLGEGPERARLEAAARSLPPGERVVLPGFRPDAANCAGAFDLFLMPSRSEGFGLALAEAMAHGIPVLASQVDSLPELLHGYPAGEVQDFDETRAETLARSIMELVGRRIACPVNRFPLDRMVDDYEKLYLSLCGT